MLRISTYLTLFPSIRLNSYGGQSFYSKTACVFALLFLTGCHSSKKERASSLEDNKVYPVFCHAAATDEDVFAHFKRSPIFNLMHECLTFEEGKEYIEALSAQNPTFLRHAEKCQKNDAIGDPRTFYYPGFGTFSPTTLSYMKIAADLEKRYGSLKGKRVIEIGGGYGGLCTVLTQLHAFESYTIVCHPHGLELIKKYLEKQGIRTVKCVTPEQLRLAENSYDLVISNYTFSENSKPLQKMYLDLVLRHAKSGYLVCTQVPKHFLVRPYVKKELLSRLKGAGIKCACTKECPLLLKGNYLLEW